MGAGAWSTVGLPAQEQFSFWREVVWEAFTPVSLAVPHQGAFLGSVSVGHAGPLRVSQIASQPQFVRRTEALVRRQPGDIFFLNVPLDEGTYAVQDGRTAQLEPGDLVLIDGTRPFTLGFGENFKQISVILPHDVLMPMLANPWEPLRCEWPEGAGSGPSRRTPSGPWPPSGSPSPSLRGACSRTELPGCWP